MTRSWAILCILTLTNIFGVNCTTRQEFHALRHHLLDNYDRHVGPQQDHTAPITMTIKFNLFSLQEFDEKSGKFVFTGFFTITWKDDRMVWDPSQHGNITTMYTKQSEVWVPLLILTRSYEQLIHIGHDFVEVHHESDGMAHWKVPDIFATSCAANVEFYPFDKQKCDMFLLPWAHRPDAYNIHLALDTMTQEDFIESGSWRLLETQMIMHKNNIVKMLIKFQRRPMFIVLNYLIPIAIVSVLSVFIFVLPPEPGERTSFGVSMLLAMAVFLSIISEKLPSSSEPHIAQVCEFLLYELFVTSLSLILATFGQKLHAYSDDIPIPSWVYYIVSQFHKKSVRKTRKWETLNKKTSKWETLDKKISKWETLDSKSEIHIHGPMDREPSPVLVIESMDQYGYPSDNYRDQKKYTGAIHHQLLSAPSSNYCSCASHRQPKRDEGELTWTDVARFYDMFFLLFGVLIHLTIYAAIMIHVSIYQQRDF